MTDEVKDLPITEEADGSVTIGKEETPPKTDEPNDHDQDHDEVIKSTDGDEAGHDEETAEEAEERRERNRARRAQNKESRKNYIESLKRELATRDAVINDLSTRVASVERQGQGNQMAQIDQELKRTEDLYNHFKTINRNAIQLADGASAVDAQEKMFAAQQRHAMLTNAKKSMAAQGNRPRALDPRLKQHAENWIANNQWYDPTGSDMDSDMVLKLDDRMVKEGWNPTTPEYWEELDSRVKKYLPHRANSRYNQGQGNSQPKNRVPVSGGNNDSGGAPKGTYRLSAERVKALKDAGVYDDPVKRADAIKRFQEYDKSQANTK